MPFSQYVLNVGTSLNLLGINMSRSNANLAGCTYLESARIPGNKYEQIEYCSRQVIIFIQFLLQMEKCKDPWE